MSLSIGTALAWLLTTLAGWFLPFSTVEAALLAGGALMLLRRWRSASSALRANLSAATLLVILLLPVVVGLATQFSNPFLAPLPDAQTESQNRQMPSPGETAVTPAPYSQPVEIAPQTAPARLMPTLVLPPRIETNRSASFFATHRVLLAEIWLIVVGVWLLGVVYQLTRIVLGWVGIIRLGRSSDPECDEEIAQTFEMARVQLGCRGPIAVRLSDRISVPMTWGWLRPLLVLPREILSWNGDQLRAALLHELAHIKRRDFAVQTLGRIACALNWHNPLVARLFRGWRTDAEQACDDRVLRSGYSGERYGDILLEVWRRAVHPRSPSSLGLAMLRESTLEHRLVAVLDPQRERGEVPTRLRLELAAIFGALTLLVAVCWLSRPVDFHLTPQLRSDLAAIRQQIQRQDATPLALTFHAEQREEFISDDRQAYEAQPQATVAEISVHLAGATIGYRAQYHPLVGRWIHGAAPFFIENKTESSDGTNTVITNSDHHLNGEWKHAGNIGSLAGYTYRLDDQLRSVVEALSGRRHDPFHYFTYGIERADLNGRPTVRLQDIVTVMGGTQRRTWWLDRLNDYALVQYEIATQSGMDGTSVRSARTITTIGRLQKVADHLWYPTEFTTERVATENGRKTDECFRSTTIISSLASSLEKSGDEAVVAAIPATLPPIYVRFDRVGLGFFGPVSTYGLSDDSKIPGTQKTLWVWCKSFTFHTATLEFIASEPKGNPQKRPDGSTVQSVDEERSDQVVPLGQDETFQIFGGVSVTVSPHLGRPESSGQSAEERPATVNTQTSSVANGAQTLTGSVRDEKGQPIQDAQVLVYTARLREGWSPLCPYTYPGCGTMVLSDAHGGFTIPQLPGGQIYQLLVAAPGFAPAYANNIDPGKGSVAVTLRRRTAADLARGDLLSGQVIDAAGKPVPGAAVSPYSFQKENSTLFGNAIEDSVAVTDATGRFSLLVTKGYKAVGLEVSAPGLSTRKFPRVLLAGSNPPLALEIGVTVTGRLMRDGKPVAGATVGIMDVVRNSETCLDELVAQTGADGRFSILHVAPHRGMTLYAKRDSMGGDGVTASKLVSTGDSDVPIDTGDMEVVPGRVVTAQIALSDGKRLPTGLHVLLDRVGAWDAQVRAPDAGGRIRFAALDGDTVTLTTAIAGYALTGPVDLNGCAQIQVGPGSENLKFVFAALNDPRFRLLGTVVNAQGRSVAGATIALFHPREMIMLRDGEISWESREDRAVSGDRGEFSVKSPQTPDDMLFVRHTDGYALVPAANLHGPVTLTPWAHVEGVARLGSQPAVGKNVNVSVTLPVQAQGVESGSLWLSENRSISADGKFAVDEMFAGPGNVTLETGRNNYAGTLIQLQQGTFTSGKTFDGSIGQPGAVVTGSVDVPNDPDLNLGWGAQVMPSRQPFDRMYYFTVARDGSFRIENVPPGSYNIAISFQGKGGWQLGYANIPLTVAPGAKAVQLPPAALESPFVPLRIGDAVPAFALETMAGKPYSNADLARTVTLLRFSQDSERWEKLYNPDFVDFLQRLGTADHLRVVSFEKTETKAELETYDRQRHEPWDECWIGDAKGMEICRAFRIANWPSYLVIDEAGKVRAIGNSPEEVRPALLQVLSTQPALAPVPAQGGANKSL